MAQLRVLVVDDSRTYRALVCEMVESSGVARVVARAADGGEALDRAAESTPDVVTLDVEMPVMSGLEALQKLIAAHPKLAVIMVSSHTQQGAKETLRALELGARDFVAKPDGPDPAANREALRSQLHTLLKGMAQATAAPAAKPAAAAPAAPRPSTGGRLPQVVAVGSSTGGPVALARIIPKLPRDLAVPIVVVQHMPPVFTASLASSLHDKSAVRVQEAKHGEPLTPGTVYIAPGGQHLRVAKVDGAMRVELTMDPPENFCRPAVDYLFRSVAQAYGDAALGVILTGMGKDGTAGLKEMKRLGARVLAQDQATCTVWGMPREAVAAGVVDLEVPLERVAEEMVAAISPKRRM